MTVILNKNRWGDDSRPLYLINIPIRQASILLKCKRVNEEYGTARVHRRQSLHLNRIIHCCLHLMSLPFYPYLIQNYRYHFEFHHSLHCFHRLDFHCCHHYTHLLVCLDQLDCLHSLRCLS